MQQDAGLRLKCLEGRLAWGDSQFHLSIERLSGRAMGLPARRLHASPGSQKAPPRGDTQCSVVPKNNLNRAGNRIARHRQYIPIPLYSITTQVRATQSISLDNLLTP